MGATAEQENASAKRLWGGAKPSLILTTRVSLTAHRYNEDKVWKPHGLADVGGVKHRCWIHVFEAA
jgi:hypothetical protein